MTSEGGEKRPGKTAWAYGKRQRRHGGRAAVLWVVEWAALLLGLLPFGGRGARWPLPKAVLALAAAGMALFLNATFIAAYFERNLLKMYEETPRVLFFSIVTSYIVFELGSLVMLLVLWLQCSSVLQLFDALRAEHSLSNAVTQRRLLHSAFSFLLVSFHFIICVLIQVLWNRKVFQMQHENVIFMASAMYSVFLMPYLHTFPLVLMITVIHVLHVALEDTNEALRHQFAPRHAGPSEPPEVHRQQDQLYKLRAICSRYVHLRRLHQVMADILAAPLIIWTLNQIFSMVLSTYCLIAQCGMKPTSTAITVECLLSLFMVGSYADGITVQAEAPQSIILDGDGATEPEKTQPEVETQVARILMACEKSLVIRPWGLYTVSRSNLLNVVMAVTTFIVVLLQFNMDDLTLPRTGASLLPPDNTSTNSIYL